MKFIELHPYADPEAAARKLMEIANSVEPLQDGRIHIELINWPFLHELCGTPAEYKAGLDLAIARGRLWLHESGTYLKFTDSGAALFALAARLASNIPSISLKAVSAFAKVLNGEPMTLTAPVRE